MNEQQQEAKKNESIQADSVKGETRTERKRRDAVYGQHALDESHPGQVLDWAIFGLCCRCGLTNPITASAQ